MTDNKAKRYVFTFNCKDEPSSGVTWQQKQDNFISGVFGTAADGPQYTCWDQIEFCICQREKGAQGTVHFQGFLILKERKRLSWLTTNFFRGAHYEVARGTPEQNIEYCSKSDTFFDFNDEEARIYGQEHARWRRGNLPERAEGMKRNVQMQLAADTIRDVQENGFIQPKKVQAEILMCPGFIQAFNTLTQDILGPHRPDLRIVTMVGPPATGKSFAIQSLLPKHGRCIYGNNGCWFQNPTEEVMIFEEFNGQIPLQRMLQLLDPYPLALEIKGRMAPAMYKLVVITSNTSPNSWYPIKEEDKQQGGDAYQRKVDSIHALWDRIGYNGGGYIPVRTTGTYLQAPSLALATGMSAMDYINACRDYFMRELSAITGAPEPITDDSDDSQSIADYLDSLSSN